LIAIIMMIATHYIIQFLAKTEIQM
jgi:hypothetical protein